MWIRWVLAESELRLSRRNPRASLKFITRVRVYRVKGRDLGPLVFDKGGTMDARWELDRGRFIGFPSTEPAEVLAASTPEAIPPEKLESTLASLSYVRRGDTEKVVGVQLRWEGPFEPLVVARPPAPWHIDTVN